MSNSQKVLTRDEVEKLMGEHVKIPEGYTEIERGAFRDGADIVHLEIPAIIKKIDAWVWPFYTSQISRIYVDPKNMYYSSLKESSLIRMQQSY